MNSIHEYRERADHYRRAAEETDDSGLRDQFNFLAGDYDQLAEDLERAARDNEN